MVQMTAFAAVMAAALFAQTMSLGGLVLVSTVLQATAVVNVPLGSAGGSLWPVALHGHGAGGRAGVALAVVPKP